MSSTEVFNFLSNLETKKLYPWQKELIKLVYDENNEPFNGSQKYSESFWPSLGHTTTTTTKNKYDFYYGYLKRQVGKSTILGYIAAYEHLNNSKVCIVAPTYESLGNLNRIISNLIGPKDSNNIIYLSNRSREKSLRDKLLFADVVLLDEHTDFTKDISNYIKESAKVIGLATPYPKLQMELEEIPFRYYKLNR